MKTLKFFLASALLGAFPASMAHADGPPSAPSSSKVCFSDSASGTQVTGSPFIFKSTIKRSTRTYKVTWKHYPVWCVPSLKSSELAIRTGWKSVITGAPSKVTQEELVAAFKSVVGKERHQSMVVRDSKNRIVATKFLPGNEEMSILVQLPGQLNEGCLDCSWYGSLTGSRALLGTQVFVDSSPFPSMFCVASTLSWRETAPSALTDVSDCPTRRPMRWDEFPKDRYKVEFTSTIDGVSTKSTGKYSISVPMRP